MIKSLYKKTGDSELLRFTIDDDSNIVKFSVNYTALIDQKAYPIIRYDNAHDYAHIDRYWTSEKEQIQGETNLEIIRLARNDITNNWKKHRKKVEKLLGI